MKLRKFKNKISNYFYMSKQEHYRKIYQQIKPGWKDCLKKYIEIINKEIDRNTRILDIGCGHADFLKSVYAKTKHTYGLDPDRGALEKNKIIQHKTVGNADKLPYPDNFFDLVVSAFTLEHLDDPKKIFSEIYRTLKPGGKTIFLTPNVYNYVIWITRLIPDCFHDCIARRLYGRQKNDTYPKKYKINSVKKISNILLPIGFKKSAVILRSDPTYISFNDTLFKLACYIEKLLSKKCFQFAKVHIIGVYQK
jgi:ubiquinone/menaquinone biosynthesis C-methylase UbiE